MADKYHKDFASFWYFYLSQHMKTATRAVHYQGTLSIALTVLYCATSPLYVDSGFLASSARWWLALASFAYMYGTAFLSHWIIEKNQPATFVYPFFSVGGDLVMVWKMTTRAIVKDVQTVRERLATGWAVDRYGFYPPEYARAHGIRTDRKLVPVAVGGN